MSELAAPAASRLDDEARARALHANAGPLIALATQLRHAVLDSAQGMKQALAGAVDRFEREMAAAGWDERGIGAASFILCVWVDEVVADTPWGKGGAGLLERFHGEPDGSAKIMGLLSRLAENPHENRALLELFHACLSLGLTGRLRDAPDAARQLETLRGRVFLTLPHDGALALAPAWHAAALEGPAAPRRRAALGALVALGLAALGVYTLSQLLLASRVDEVFASMQQIGVAGDSKKAPSPAPAPRLAPSLADDLAAGRLSVRDEAHRSIVSVPAELLFERGSTHLSSAAGPFLTRVAAALARSEGKVLVIGHTDGSDARSARLPSAWHQSYEWAREAADALGHELGADRLAVEGAADQVFAADAALPRRRVDIVWYP